MEAAGKMAVDSETVLFEFLYLHPPMPESGWFPRRPLPLLLAATFCHL